LSDKARFIGFKFVLPSLYPYEAPLTYLDEPENKQVIEFIDYIDQGNVIMFKYLADWKTNYNSSPANYNLQMLLNKVYQLYCQAPPVPFDEE
jgi:hypothetical protein